MANMDDVVKAHIGGLKTTVQGLVNIIDGLGQAQTDRKITGNHSLLAISFHQKMARGNQYRSPRYLRVDHRQIGNQLP
jgi:hypothetical protein